MKNTRKLKKNNVIIIKKLAELQKSWQKRKKEQFLRLEDCNLNVKVVLQV